ncbi:MAG TPA: ornithine cyclodeaminase family protein [Thermoanaerobaculia bacterium]|nr:ornithine cyclodeaminase family protein [Thermoanaerobaculia bacterium]
MNDLLILGEHDVRSLLTMPECIEVMDDILRRLALGEGHQPLRNLMRPPDAAGFLGLMPSFVASPEPYFGLKAVCVFPGNPARGLDSHLGGVLLYSGETGQLLAVMNASAITAIRTAAVTAVATRALARPESSVLAIIGAGVQAAAHLEAMAGILRLAEVRVAGLDRGRLERFVARATKQYSAFSTMAAASVEEAVRDADVVVTVTSSREPVLKRPWIADGAHINLVGSSVPAAREADGATMAAGRLFVDRRESTINESGDYLMALAEGAIGPDHIAGEVGEVLLGELEGRRSPDEITIFKSLGLAIEDLAAARHLYRKARELGRGTAVRFDAAIES